MTMIMLTRLNGLPFALNPDLIERAEATPDTVITLCDGHKVLVTESVEQLIELVRQYRASVLALVGRLESGNVPSGPALHAVPTPLGEK
jgi:flagellar protein FlbD